MNIKYKNLFRSLVTVIFVFIFSFIIFNNFIIAQQPYLWEERFGADWRAATQRTLLGVYSGQLTSVSLEAAVWQYYNVNSSLVLYYKDDDNDSYGDQDATIGPPSEIILVPASVNPDICPSQLISTDCNNIPICEWTTACIAAFVPNNDDCIDADLNIHPDAIENCDNIDNNCNNSIDEGCDNDNDGYCDEDMDGDGMPDSPPRCSGSPTTCGNGGCIDLDCDDDRAIAHPGGVEVCGNAVDEDCDGTADSCPCIDIDGDEYCADVDCNDNDPFIYPNAFEACDNIDNDCVENPDGSDLAGWGTETSCGTGACASTGRMLCIGGGGALQDDCVQGVGSVDNDCDGIDDDCDGEADQDYNPALNPTTCGVGVCVAFGQLNCSGGVTIDTCVPGPPDCTTVNCDNDCDEEDDDCNGAVDEDGSLIYYRDADGDNYGDPFISDYTCEPDPGYVLDNTDCDDTSNPGGCPAITAGCDDTNTGCAICINPGMDEGSFTICSGGADCVMCSDGIDNDCDDGDATGGIDCVDASCNGVDVGDCGSLGECDEDIRCFGGAQICMSNGDDCLDGNVCTDDTLDWCDNGVCQPGSSILCDDSTACTSDSCDSILGCQYSNAPAGTTCEDDSNACTDDECDGAGSCQNIAIDCTDTTICTTDSCDSVLGCQNDPVAAGTTCEDDSNACTDDECNATGT
ncbi:putative metal-binding motif-containing protein, partial [Patescibacteria group bacterium]|nr:putative metal-binding motif-containing protein [Patescibacteria group bacterium]